MKYILSTVLFSLCMIFASSAVAQGLTYDLGGHQVHCKDSAGTPVRIYSNPHLSDIGKASAKPHPMTGQLMPYIIMNPRELRKLPMKVRLFWFAHECSHQALGHIRYYFRTGRYKRTGEVEADCKAVQILQSQYRFSRNDIRSVGQYLLHLQGSPAGHLPGPQRANHLLRCAQ